jgi:hypothetical protein
VICKAFSLIQCIFIVLEVFEAIEGGTALLIDGEMSGSEHQISSNQCRTNQFRRVSLSLLRHSNHEKGNTYVTSSK